MATMRCAGSVAEWLLKPGCRIYLGDCASYKSAMRKAKQHYDRVDGCYFCSRVCHTGQMGISMTRKPNSQKVTEKRYRCCENDSKSKSESCSKESH